MRFQGLDLNLLVALDALLEERNVTVAGERVHLSQSAMSGALGRLREYFKDDLLVSQGRQMLLTPRAESLIGPLKTALIQIRITLGEQEFNPATTRRLITIAAADYAVTVLLGPAVAAMAAAAPHIRFQFEQVDHVALRKLEQGNLDLLVTLEQLVSPDHPAKVMFDDEYVAVVWTGNTAIGPALTAEQYFEMGHMSIRPPDDRNPALEDWLGRAATKPRRIEIVAWQACNVPPLLVGTNRIATLHRRLADHFVQLYPCRILPLPFNTQPSRQMVQWHELNGQDQCIQWIIARLEEYCARHLGSGEAHKGKHPFV